MNFSQIFLTTAEILSGLGLFFFGGGYLLSKFKDGTKESQAEGRDIISSNEQIKQFFKDQNEDYKTIIKEQGSKIELLTREVGEIRGQLTAESKIKEQYLAILQNRDPETKQFMEIMLKFVETQTETNKNIVKALQGINDTNAAEHNKELKVEAHITKV